MPSSLPEPQVDHALLGPYVQAAAIIVGRADAPLDQRIATVARTALDLRDQIELAALSRPIRSFRVVGTLAIHNTNNPHRTCVAIDTGDSSFGPDTAWTEYEERDAAQRTRAALATLVGQRVALVKETFVETYPDGTPKLTDGKTTTRTRIKPGTLELHTDQGFRPVDLTKLTAPRSTAG
ncbi:hypothetical protein GKE82_24015 [Conexibacter sp. W3-3-2]|uniref:hypothetical protein n=1 Tax=Conexibacter sp. W3-3-2 TaxID=2675227 RepID=UPI0012B9DCC0|nr:hypothetical protein [Conexibacter sp. W3-3-2]MTD47274.1 hypothetical protein [Conexibacter sp. W3-3-2]